MKPLMIAHRGDTVNFPENTIGAFKSAFDKGAGGVELDVHLDKDEKVIVVHNYLFDESGNYPLLEDVIKQFGQRGRLQIEIKSLDPTCILKVGELIKRYKPADTEITSSVLPLFPYIKKEFGGRKIGLIFQSKLIEEWMPKEFIEKLILSYMQLTGANILHMPYEYYTKNIIDLMHMNGFKINSYIKNKGIDDYNKIVDLGADQIVTDDINLIQLI